MCKVKKMICYEVRNIEWEYDGRVDDMSTYPTEVEFVDDRINGVGTGDAVGHILKNSKNIGVTLEKFYISRDMVLRQFLISNQCLKFSISK